jgi:hypothetical protein
LSKEAWLFLLKEKSSQKVIPILEWFRDDGLSKSSLDFSLHEGLFDMAN